MDNLNQDAAQLKEHVVEINRVAKVVKGGRRFSFNAIVIVGDGNGTIGYGLGKANEVVNAIQKGTEKAKKNLSNVSLKGKTIPHPIKAKYGAGIVEMRPASEGTGVIAGGPIRALCEAAGIHDIFCNSQGSSNTHNVVKAAMRALVELESAQEVADRRGMSVSDLYKG